MAPKKIQTIRNRKKAEDRATDAEIEGFSIELEVFLTRSIKKVLKDVTTPEEAVRALTGIEQTLESEGIQQVYGKAADIYAARLNYIQEQFEELGGVKINFDGLDLDIAEVLIQYDLEKIADAAKASVSDVRSAVFRQVLGGNADFDDVISGATESLRNTLKTEINTAVAGFERSVTLKKARDNGFTRFLYVGGIIETSRDFCIERDGNIYTQKEIDSWDNGQGLPANVYLGGYNCRHSLTPVDDTTAEILESEA